MIKLGPWPKPRDLVFLAILGAIGGTFGDALHVITQVDGYPEAAPGALRFFPKMANWVPLLFAAATMALGASHPVLDPTMNLLFGGSKKDARRPGVASPRRNALGLIALLAIWGTSGILPLATGGAKDVVLAAAALGVWKLVDGTLPGLFMAVLCALAGVGAEAMLVHFGAFYYYPEFSNLLGVPSWLCWLYIAAGPTVGNMGRILTASKAAAGRRS